MPAGRSRYTSNARAALAGRSLAQETMNSAAFESRSFSRKGEGSIALNSCFSSVTWISMTLQFSGIGSPGDGLRSVTKHQNRAIAVSGVTVAHVCDTSGILFGAAGRWCNRALIMGIRIGRKRIAGGERLGERLIERRLLDASLFLCRVAMRSIDVIGHGAASGGNSQSSPRAFPR